MHSMINSVDVKSEIPLGLEQVRPLDLRTDIRMMAPMMDPLMQEKQLQQELILIQHQQQIQKQLLIAEFQKQHENLTRQHQAQIQEHIKLQKELLAIKHQQELLEKEQKLEQQRQEQELERHRREQCPPIKSRERSRERAVASTEVKQKLQEFLLSKSAAKDSLSSGKNHSSSRRPKLWHMASHHTSLDQASPPLCGTSSYKYTLPGAQDAKDDFPLRKTGYVESQGDHLEEKVVFGRDSASEPNLKVRSKLKQKVTERRSSPLLRRKDGTMACSLKKRLIEMTESSVGSSSPGSGPSSPCNGPTRNTENETSVLPLNSSAEVPQHCIFINEESMNLLNLYASPSLPNITLGLPAVQPPLTVSSSFVEKQKNEMQSSKQGVAMSSQPRGTISSLSSPQPIVPEGKPNYSHQAILQHLLLKEKMRQQKLLPIGTGSLHPQSPLATNESVSPGLRAAHKLPRHRPLNRTQSAPLPQSTLAQLVIQQQHQQFLEKQKQYQQQIHMNKMLSKSIEQLKQPGSLEEAEEELQGEHLMQEEGAAPVGVSIRDDSSSISLHNLGQPFGAVKVKEEPKDSDDDIQNQQMESGEQSAFMQQVIGTDLAPDFIIKVII
ncbi:histone deacetylase 9-like [Ahaetulla prasina]|uniref:histone deacetylase 9-like n=1 Tax=Ahaetulla prasina TaxID=499056 RepID=UPI0026478C6A|nr:histone deacetylase 9-like [Ahaetulla prasina]